MDKPVSQTAQGAGPAPFSDWAHQHSRFDMRQHTLETRGALDSVGRLGLSAGELEIQPQTPRFIKSQRVLIKELVHNSYEMKFCYLCYALKAENTRKPSLEMRLFASKDVIIQSVRRVNGCLWANLTLRGICKDFGYV